MKRSTRNLAPHLQELWTQVYAIAWGHNAYQDTEGNPKNAHDCAEEAAWEAVTRANGGVTPGSLDAVEELAPIVASVLWPRDWPSGSADMRHSILEAMRAALRNEEIVGSEGHVATKTAMAVWKALREGTT